MSKNNNTIKVQGSDQEFPFNDHISIQHENRVVHVVRCEDGTIGLHTIRTVQDGPPVQTGYRFSKETFSMLISAMTIGAMAWNIDVNGFQTMLADGNGNIHVEFEKGGDVNKFLEDL